MTDRLVLLLVLLAGSSLAWWIVRRRDGRFRTPASSPSARDVLDASEIGGPVTGHATFVLVSSAACSTCPQVRRVLTALADAEPGVSFREVPAESHMPLVRRLDVLRTPTVLLLDGEGAVRSRTSGPLRADQARTALDRLVADRRVTDPPVTDRPVTREAAEPPSITTHSRS